MSFAFCPVRVRNCRVVQHPFGEGNRGRVWPCAIAVFVLFLSFLLIHGVAAAHVKPTRRILILNEVNPSYPATAIINQGIQTALSNSPYRLEFYLEYMDFNLFPDPAVQQEFRDFYLRKYRNRQPDVIITAGSSPLEFMQEVNKSAFPGVPIVFCLPLGDVPSALELGSYFTGVESDIAPAETLQIALRLQPGTEHVVVVGGVTVFDKKQEALIKQQIKGLTDHLDITYMTDLAVPDLLERLRRLPRHTLVILSSLASDADGTHFKSNEIGPLVASTANAPVFTLFDVYLNHGEVGGYLSNFNEQGKVAGGMALKILRGEKAQDIPRVKGVNTYMFDWRAVKRWGLKEGEIPPGSIVLNRQPGFWESYKQYVLVGILVLLAQAMAILGLLWERASRRKTEAELRKSEEKFAKSFRQSPLAVTISSANDSRYLEVNETFERQTGWSRDELIGRTPFDIDLWADPDKRVAFMKELHQTGTVRDLEFRFRRKDGQIRTALGSSELIEVNRERCALSVATDITDRKEAEKAITALTGRLIDAQEDERKRIARELHDDYNQRLAMLAMDLDQVAADDENGGIETGQYLRQLSKHASELADDLHSLSHQLHSSTLKNLGLVAGVESFCEEFEEQQGIKVDFTHKNVPPAVPEDLALCLFRVAQEALRNVKRHSGANRAVVHLEWLDGKLQLMVSDRGRGFDSNKRAAERGIGVQSMEERLRALGGSFEVRSQPMKGTRIGAWLPLEVDGRRTA
jgi:PAS domain S-box-containing protein